MPHKQGRADTQRKGLATAVEHTPQSSGTQAAALRYRLSTRAQYSGVRLDPGEPLAKRIGFVTMEPRAFVQLPRFGDDAWNNKSNKADVGRFFRRFQQPSTKDTPQEESNDDSDIVQARDHFDFGQVGANAAAGG